MSIYIKMLYTNKYINIISLFITIIIFLIFNFIYFNFLENPLGDFSNIISKFSENNKKMKEEENVLEEQLDLGDWYLEIPSINLKAPIAEGVTQDILNNKVGHFENTAWENGNVGLAAHNKGYEYNFFENLKSVKKEDEIIYTHGEYKKRYMVETIEIIQNTDWSYLEFSDENKITLITCVENQPEYRRCVQGVAIEN